MQLTQQQLIQYGITGAIVLVVLFFRLRGMARTRPLKVERLWIVPAIYVVVVALALAATPPQPSDLPWLGGAFLLGGFLGWYRGKMMRITVEPETHALNQQASPLAMILILAVLGLRSALRYTLAEDAAAWGVRVNVLTDAPLLFLVGMFALARVEMYLRAQRLLQEARAAKGASSSAPAR